MTVRNVRLWLMPKHKNEDFVGLREFGNELPKSAPAVRGTQSNIVMIH